ncbi:hypothetical protein LSH36_147g02008 [Paralvinella palmiformis]|uniref:Uncharacterized protein n=1 Tax=Paralvinella palmiformis TaxID=53620 RepID=A0AAD9N7J0_9ANNE|nr:hypothetical protein LSH36_147g02008 [Paralvinella palmiformis]
MAKPDPDASHNVHPDRYCGCQKNSFGERRTHEQIDDQGLTVVQMNIPLCNSDDDNDHHHDQDIDCGGDDDDVVVRDNDLLVNSSSPRYGDKATDLGNNVSFQIRSLTTRINDDRGRCGLTNTQERAILVGFLIGLSLGLLYVSWALISRHFHNRTNGDDVNPVLLDVSERYNDSSLPASILDDVSQKDSIIATIRRPLFIAVLTQKKFLSTRGAACNLTWARSSYVTDVEFFTEENEPSMSSLRHGNIVTYLTGNIDCVVDE